MIAGDFVEPGFSQSLYQVIILVVVVQDLFELLAPGFDSYPHQLVPVEVTDIVKEGFFYELPSSLGFLWRRFEDYQLFHIAVFNQRKTFIGVVSKYLTIQRVVELVKVIELFLNKESGRLSSKKPWRKPTEWVSKSEMSVR